MTKQQTNSRTLDRRCKLQESRTPRFNVPVRHPSKWALLFERALAAPIRLHRFKNMSVRMFEDSVDRVDEWRCS